MKQSATMLLVAVSLLGCAEKAVVRPTSSVASVDPQRPCGLLSPDQVQVAIKAPVRGETEVGGHDLTTRICLYRSTEPWSSVGVSLEDEVERAEFRARLRRDPVNSQSLEDVGEGAFIHACASVTVYSNRVLVSAGVQHVTTCAETGVVLTRLARAIELALRG